MKTKLITAAVAILVLLLGVQTYRLIKSQTACAEIGAEFTAYKLNQAEQALSLQNGFITSLVIISEQARKDNEQTKADDAAAYAVALNDNNSMYKQQIARLRASCNSTTTTGGKDATDPIGVLANVLTRTDEAAGTYARVADERGVALNACIAAYKAIGN